MLILAVACWTGDVSGLQERHPLDVATEAPNALAVVGQCLLGVGTRGQGAQETRPVARMPIDWGFRAGGFR